MEIDKMTVGEIKEIKSMFGGCTAQDSNPYRVGEKYLIRTVTHYYIGVLKAVYQQELLLSSASWIADTGRYYDALKKGTLNEVEPIIGDAIIGRGSIIDAVQWAYDVPKDQK